MKRPDTARPARVAEAFLAAATLLLAAALIFQCAAIYWSGVSPDNRTETGLLLRDIYTPAIVAERLTQIHWAFFLWLAALAAVWAARAVYPRENSAAPGLSVQSRWELFARHRAPDAAMRAERRKRRAATAAWAVVCAACGIAIGLYWLESSHFESRELESVMGEMLAAVTPWLALAFVALAALTEYRHRSMLRELAAAKGAPLLKRERKKVSTRAPVQIGRVALLVCAVALLALGVLNGGMYDVLVKAINICSECIGLG